MNLPFTRTIEDKIRERVEKIDKNGNPFLILWLEAKNKDIFVFPSKIKENCWIDFQLQEKFSFVVEEGKFANNILISYEKVIDIFSY